MHKDSTYMQRCLQLAQKGKGWVSPNPMVGAVVVYKDKIIGEGYHREYGQAHAEVNAINNVKDKSLLSNSTLYISLEPCSHYGKTPPCTQLITDCRIPTVRIACLDPYPKVSGRGIKMLENAGIQVKTGILEKEAQQLNKTFFTRQLLHRPYIYLKWAQTKDNFIDKLRLEEDAISPTPISSPFTKMLVHKLRAEVSAILTGTNTVLLDNPSLTTREWFGKNPTRIVLDRTGKIPPTFQVFNNEAETVIFTERVNKHLQDKKTKFLPLSFDENMIVNLLRKINELHLDSLLVEGGTKTLQSFIDAGLWDEAFIEISETEFKGGVTAPVLNGKIISDISYGNSRKLHLIKEKL